MTKLFILSLMFAVLGMTCAPSRADYVEEREAHDVYQSALAGGDTVEADKWKAEYDRLHAENESREAGEMNFWENTRLAGEASGVGLLALLAALGMKVRRGMIDANKQSAKKDGVIADMQPYIAASSVLVENIAGLLDLLPEAQRAEATILLKQDQERWGVRDKIRLLLKK